MCLALFLVSKCQGPSPLLLSLSLTTKIPDLLSVSICPRGSAMRRHGGRSGGGGRGGAWLWVSSLGSFNCFVPLSQQRKKEREKQRRKERKSPPKEHIPKKKKKPNQNQTKPNHQLKYTKYTFTKGDKHGYPVYFLGDLVIQAYMAKPPQNPKEPHTDEPM